MKTEYFDHVMKVVCPICKKIVIKDDVDDIDRVAKAKPCKHLRLWNTAGGQANPYIHPSMRYQVKKTSRIL